MRIHFLPIATRKNVPFFQLWIILSSPESVIWLKLLITFATESESRETEEEKVSVSSKWNWSYNTNLPIILLRLILEYSIEQWGKKIWVSTKDLFYPLYHKYLPGLVSETSIIISKRKTQSKTKMHLTNLKWSQSTAV